MRERHPIDDIFRRGLAAAEVEPPAAVWEGVLHQRSGRRRLVVVWRRVRWMGLLALLVGAPALWWASTVAPQRMTVAPVQASTVHPGSANTPMGRADRSMTPSMVATVPALAANKPTAASPARASDTAPSGLSITSRETGSSSTTPAARAEGVRAATNPLEANIRNAAVERTGVAPTALTTRAEPARERTSAAGIHAGSSIGALSEEARSIDGAVNRMAGRPSAFVHAVSAATPGSRPQPTSYVLPGADWWLAAVVGRFDRSRRWMGTDPELVSARADLDGHAGEWHVGLWAGRRWRSGTWLGLGVEHTGGRSAYERFDQSQQVNTLVNTSVAIFENTVLATQSDTQYVVLERSETIAVTGRSSTWRVPLLLGWEHGVRRWVFGAHVGLTLEWQHMRDGYLFREETTEEGLVVQRTERVREADRSFGLVSAQVALDGGLLLTEHWRLTAGPVYQVGLGVVLGEGAVQALPTRLGGQVRLSIDLPHRQR